MFPNGDIASWSAASDAALGASHGDVAIEVLDGEQLLGIGLGADILVVDDDEHNLIAYEAALAPLGRAIVLVRSGTQALAQLLNQDFALLLLDVSMPEPSGIVLSRANPERFQYYNYGYQDYEGYNKYYNGG